jgi:hypothetical protein
MSLGIALVIAATSIQASVMPAVSSAEAPMPPKPNRALGIAEASPLPELLPDESRTPLQADLTEEAAVVPDVPKVRIRPDGTLPPGLEVDPHRSGRNFVAYRSAEDHQQHVAKVFTRDVNFRNPSGKWQRLRLQTVPQRGGWQARTGIDEPATVALPARLGGVTWSSDEGTVVTELQGLADVRGRRAGLSGR